MSNESAFFESWTNVPHVILGRKLQPLSIFHYVWLYQVGSPLVYTAKPATMADLELAVLICSSSTNEQVLAVLEGKGILQRMRNYFWRKANRKRNLQTELTKFIAYNDDHIALPEFYSSDTKEINERLPWLFVVAASLIKTTGWTEEKVFSMPIGKVFWLNLAFHYLETGKTSIISDKEQLAMKILGEMNAAGLTGAAV